MKRIFPIIALALLALTSSAQVKTDAVTVKIDDKVFIVRVAEDNRIRNFIGDNVYPPYKDGFGAEMSGMTCRLLFQASAMRKRDGEAVVILRIGTMEGSDSNSIEKRVVVKKGEKKALNVKSKLECMYFKQYAVTISY